MTELWGIGRQVLEGVHPRRLCEGKTCVIHNPSDTHMKDWPLNWRQDTGVMERICPCGVGHPDADHLVFAKTVGLGWHAIHGCCAFLHCAPPDSGNDETALL